MLRAADYKRILCPAKLNLVLRVGQRQRDGYHALETLMVPIAWGDELSLSVEPAKTNKISLICPGLDLPQEKNLAYRAAYGFCEEFNFRNLDIRIRLSKRVPTGAGLGGGSSDAAMVLKLLARSTRRPIDTRLHKLARSLGADVPFFLYAKPSWCTGVGDQCKPLKKFRPLNFVIVLSPKTPVPTGWAYHSLDEWRERRRIASRLQGLPESWQRSDWVVPDLVNDFEDVVLESKAPLRKVKMALAESGALAAAMSGSGSSFFGVYSTSAEARKASLWLRRQGFQAIFTQAA